MILLLTYFYSSYLLLKLIRDAAFTVHNDFSDELRQQFLDMYQANIKSIVSQDVSEGTLLLA